MLTKIMTVFVTAAALAAGPTADAVAFSGGVSHVVTHPLAMTTAAVTAMPITRPTAAIRRRDVCQHHGPQRMASTTLANPCTRIAARRLLIRRSAPNHSVRRRYK
jgi:hypothetical protein